MDTLDLLLTRRSISAKDMAEPGPDDATLTRILSAGLRVPDHGKLGPWRIQVLRKPGQAALGEVLARIFRAENPQAEERQVELERNRPQRAPILLAVTARIDPLHPKIPVMEQKLSGGALCQNILVASHAAGFAAQWLTEWPAYHPAVRELLGHTPVTEIIGFIYIGTPTVPPSERPRPTLEQAVSEWAGPTG